MENSKNFDISYGSAKSLKLRDHLSNSTRFKLNIIGYFYTFYICLKSLVRKFWKRFKSVLAQFIDSRQLTFKATD